MLRFALLLVAVVAGGRSAVAQDSSAVLKGQVTLKGDAPAPKKFKAEDPKIQEAYPNGVLYEPVPVDKEKHVKSALVYVKAGLEGKVFPAPKEPKALEVEKFQFTPRLMGVMVGQEIVVTNRDDAPHNPHAHPLQNFEINVGLRERGMTHKATFAKPELAIPVRCNLHHDWERAWVAVLPHPFFCVTDEQGRYEIAGLPPGKYTLEAWQENCTPSPMEIEVKAKESKAVDFILELRVRAHLFISGRVQGVGFRASTEEEAKRVGDLVGWVKNLADGRVEAVLQGPRDKVEKLVQWCRKGPPTAQVTQVERKDEPFADEFKTFEVRY